MFRGILSAVPSKRAVTLTVDPALRQDAYAWGRLKFMLSVVTVCAGMYDEHSQAGRDLILYGHPEHTMITATAEVLNRELYQLRGTGLVAVRPAKEDMIVLVMASFAWSEWQKMAVLEALKDEDVMYAQIAHDVTAYHGRVLRLFVPRLDLPTGVSFQQLEMRIADTLRFDLPGRSG